MSQSWPLSQEANKATGICSVCRATRQLHFKDGTVHKHGPRNKPCQGSHKPPLSVVRGLDSQAHGSQAQGPSDHGASESTEPSTDNSNCIVSSTSKCFSPVEGGVIKHIPKSARSACATHLAALLRAATDHPEAEENWFAVMNWSSSILQPPTRGGKRHNVSNTIRKRIAEFSSSTPPPSGVRGTSRQRKLDPQTTLAQAISTKLEDGNLRAAIRLVCSDDTPAAPSRETLASLEAKHPSASPMDLSLANAQCNSLSVDQNEVRKAVLSFPAGSSGGPDGLRPQHLKDLVQCRESGSIFLTALTGFVNMVLAGRCPVSIAPLFFGGRLIALTKKSGGIRPIAIGMTLRRLASKCANSFATSKLASYLHPRQLGVGTAGGCEAAVHAARRYLSSMPNSHVVVKLDFSNAFNSLHRSDMLQAVLDRVPEVFSYCYSSYARPSRLFFGPYTVMSQEGPQQGDPLGSLLFSNTAHPLLQSLSSDLTLGYLDDVTLGGPVDIVAADVQTIVKEGREMGLQLNSEKCEVIAHQQTTISDPLLCSFIPVKVEDATLLGAPLFVGSALDDAWASRCAELSRAIDRLKSLGAQDALILLRASFSAPRVQHLMRCSPSGDNPALEEFDKLLRSAVSHLTNCNLTDAQWLQASLPIKMGGLGVRRVSSLALPAYLASAAGTLSLQDTILTSSTTTQDTYFATYQSQWLSIPDAALPTDSGMLPTKQSFWDKPGLARDRQTVENSKIEAGQRAQFLAASADHSGDWLLALPVASCGLRLDDEAVRVAVSIRLGLNLGAPHTCRCGAEVDARGLHGLVCKRAPSRIARHQQLNDLVTRALVSAGVPAIKEPIGLIRQDGKRPDGATQIPWQAGRMLAWDVTVISTLADSYVSVAARGAGEVAELAANRKCEKYANIPGAYSFLPIAVETHGAMNADAYDFFGNLGRRISDDTGDPREVAFIFQRLSVLIQRFNSALYSETFVLHDDSDL